MKIPLVVALAGLVIGFSLPAFAQQKDTVDPQTAQQVRVLAMKYDEAMNKHDAAAIASLYTQNGVKESDFGTSHGRQSIEKSYAKYEFQRWPVSNFSTRVNRVIKAGNELRSTGTWSGVFTNHSGGHDNDGGYYAWALVRDGDTWKIRKNTTHGAGNPFGTNFSQKSQKWPAFGLSRMARRQG